jgi:isopenicillin-N epimerase
MPFAGADQLFPLDPRIDQLNHGGFGVAPLPVMRAQQGLRDEMEANPTRFMTRGLQERVEQVRTELAGFIGAAPERSALVGNTTTGVSMVLHTIGLSAGDEVITTDHGYGAVELAISGYGGRLVSVPVDLDMPADELVAALLAARTPRTRLVVLDLISSRTAWLFPVAEVARAMRAAGLPLLVDGAHAPGAVPLDVTAIDADFFVGNLHKWAYAPRGTALLTVGEQWVRRMRPLVVSWADPVGFPHAVEFSGSLDYTGWLAAPAGLAVLYALGAERVRAHNDELAAYGQRVLADALGVAEPPQPAGPVPMRIIPLPPLGIAADKLQMLIADQLGAQVSITSWREQLWLRVCAQVYNRPEQYDRLATGLPGLLADLA